MVVGVTRTSYLWQHHPLVPHRWMIAYDATLVLLPATLLGSTAGVFLNKMCPNWLIVALLVALCAFSGKHTLDKAWKARVAGRSNRLGGGQEEQDGTCLLIVAKKRDAKRKNNSQKQQK